jgi:hypothetical protein
MRLCRQRTALLSRTRTGTSNLQFCCLALKERRGCAAAQAVSRRLPTVTAWVRSKARSYGTCGRPEYLHFPLPILIPANAPYSSIMIRSWHNRLTSGRRTKRTQSHPTRVGDAFPHYDVISFTINTKTKKQQIDIMNNRNEMEQDSPMENETLNSGI